MMEEKQFNEFRLQEMITRREGMIAENKQREHLGQSMAYTDDNFQLLADEIRTFMVSR
jgi:hypothetical protein